MNSNSLSSTTAPDTPTPHRKRPREDLQVASISGGIGYAIALVHGAAIGWGDNSIGQCGQPETLLTCPCPRNIHIPITIHEISTGCNHTLCKSSTGQVWGWGGNGVGQCGIGITTTAQFSPRLISIPGWPSSGIVTRIAAGGWHSVALTASNDVYVWGWGAHGQLGPIDTAAHSAPGLLLAMFGKSELGKSIPHLPSKSWITQLVTPQITDEESDPQMSLLHRLLLWSLIPETGLHSGLLHTTPQPLHLVDDDDDIIDISAGLLHTSVRYADHWSSWGVKPGRQSITVHLTDSEKYSPG